MSESSGIEWTMLSRSILPRYCKLGRGCGWCKGERQITVGVSEGVSVRR